MKAQSSSPLHSGAFNEASQTMSNQLNTYINSNVRPENVTLFQNNNIGVARDKQSLSVQVDTIIEKLWNLPGILGLPGNSQHGHFLVIRHWSWNLSNYLIRSPHESITPHTPNVNSISQQVSHAFLTPSCHCPQNKLL